jgi:hypothetical protein
MTPILFYMPGTCAFGADRIAESQAAQIEVVIRATAVASLFQRFKSDHGVEFAESIEQQTVAKSNGGYKGEVRIEDVF